MMEAERQKTGGIDVSVLLLGNGINLNEGFTKKWETLLADVAENFGCAFESSLSNALTYEMVESQILKTQDGKTVHEIRRKIAEGLETKKLKDMKTAADWKDTLHARLTALPVKAILTTNYDYALERSLEPRFRPRYNTRETTYSLYRYQEAGKRRIYHVHGESGYPSSICLGYGQYAGTLQRIREQIVRSTKSEGEGHSYLLADVLKKLTKQPENDWIFDFFLENVYILGLSLDVSELELWWLLSYRSSQLISKRLPIANRIVYLDTGSDEVEDAMPDCTQPDCAYKQQALAVKKVARARKKALLEAFHVEYYMCRGSGFPEQYEDALSWLKKNCK